MSRKILVADDEAHILHIVRMKLSNAGYEVLTAVDGQEAIEIFLSEGPDLLITDYQMPGMTGLELCRQIKECGAMSVIPVVMLTSREFDIEPGEIQRAGITTILAKPFSPRELLAKVEQLLNSSATAARGSAQ